MADTTAEEKNQEGFSRPEKHNESCANVSLQDRIKHRLVDDIKAIRSFAFESRQAFQTATL